jgi:hypothetical protein
MISFQALVILLETVPVFKTTKSLNIFASKQASKQRNISFNQYIKSLHTRVKF